MVLYDIQGLTIMKKAATIFIHAKQHIKLRNAYWVFHFSLIKHWEFSFSVLGCSAYTIAIIVIITLKESQAPTMAFAASIGTVNYAQWVSQWKAQNAYNDKTLAAENATKNYSDY